MMKLPAILAIASKELDLSLQKTRLAVQHNLSSGQVLEEAIREFLRKHLHAGLGITQGQVVDTAGNTTKQLDVIVYDAQTTPMLFTSEQQGHQLVPIEGVLGVIEVKSKVTASTLGSIIENMTSVKRLAKNAFYRPTAPPPMYSTYNLYGQELRHFPVIYSLFAFESSEMENLVPAFQQLNDVLPPAQRIDNTCILDKGIIANLTTDRQFDAVPNSTSKSSSLETEHALVAWYIMIQRLYSQAKPEPINMQAYLGPNFKF